MLLLRVPFLFLIDDCVEWKHVCLFVFFVWILVWVRLSFGTSFFLSSLCPRVFVSQLVSFSILSFSLLRTLASSFILWLAFDSIHIYHSIALTLAYSHISVCIWLIKVERLRWKASNTASTHLLARKSTQLSFYTWLNNKNAFVATVRCESWRIPKSIWFSHIITRMMITQFCLSLSLIRLSIWHWTAPMRIFYNNSIWTTMWNKRKNIRIEMRCGNKVGN